MNDVDTLLNRLCHLMVAFEHTIGDLVDRSGAKVSLDMPALAVLVSLDLYGEMRPTTIAQLLGGTTSMATKVIGRLERDERLERRLGALPDDRRAVTVHVSEGGRRAIAACETALTELSVDLLAAMAAVEVEVEAQAADPVADGGEVPGSTPPSTAPALAELLRFIVEIDAPLLATVGDLDVLHPRDPRALLVLSELDRRGPQRLGAIPALIDRSRSTTHRLCGDLEALGLLARGDDPADQRQVVLEITPVGRAVLRGAVAGITAHLPHLRPSMRALSQALAGERRSLGAPVA